MEISLFVPCLVEDLYPEIGEAAARVLVRAGAKVLYTRGQTCCGRPVYEDGRFDQARSPARRFLDLFENAGYVVAPSGSCVHMVKHRYLKLFANEPAMLRRAKALSSRVFELCDFLVNVMKVVDVGAYLEGTAVYHDSCRVGRALGLRKEPRILLCGVRGLELKELARPDACCGFGGAFSVRFPEVSDALVADKVADVLESGAKYVVSAEVSCFMNIKSYLEARGLDVKALHMAQVLDSGGGSKWE
ncbi:MAG: (Fe-S)-binding protein [Thermodesulfobacteriota bacterium]|nr:(Fe-S)-binding protein [Thermodesulfobacteriota bacterium]